MSIEKSLKIQRVFEALAKLDGYFKGMETSAIFQDISYKHIHEMKIEVSVIESHVKDILIDP